MPVAQAEESKQPRKLEPEVEEGNVESTPESSQNESSVSASKVQEPEGDGNQGVKQTYLPEGGEQGQAVSNSPETIHHNLEPDINSGTSDFGHRETDDGITYVTTTTTTATKVEEQNVHKMEESVAARDTNMRSSMSSRTFSGQQRNDVQSTIQGGLRKKTSFFQEIRFPSVTEAGQPPSTLSSMAVESRRVMVPPNSSLEQLLQIQRLHREEKDRILDFMTAEYESYKRFSEEQFEVFRMENERLLRELSASTSRVSVLEIRLNSRSGTHSETTPQHDNIDSTITTTITTITTTITTVTKRIEQCRQAVARNKGQINISNKDLEQLLSDLSTASSQITDLQQNYARMSGDFSSVRYQLQVTLSLRDEKDRTIAALTAEVAQWKNTDAAKAQQIIAVRRDNDMLRRDISAASSRTAELQQRHDEQSRELGSARKELQTKASSIEERDRKIASFTAEVAHWKQSDIAKAEQISTVRRDYEKLQRDHAAFSSRIAELQSRFDAQSMELGSVRDELQANKSLAAEKDRTITTLAAEVEQWERADATRTELLAAEHRDKEQLQRDLATFSSQTADLQRRYDAQSNDIVSIRNELQTRTSHLEEKEHIITSLTTELSQARREEGAKAEQVATARRDLEQLRVELASSSDQHRELQERYVTQSQELSSVRDELRQIELLYVSGTDQGTKPSKAAIAQHIARALEEKNKLMEELRRDLAAATSRNAELQKSYEALLRETSATQGELKDKASQHESTIASLTAQVEQWKRSDTTKTGEISNTLKHVERLQTNLTTSTSQLADLQSRYEAQSRDLIVARNDLQTLTSSSDGKDRTVASLTAEVDQWKRVDASKMQEIATSLKKIEALQRDLSASASKLAELQGRYEARTREFNSLRDELQSKTSLYEGNARSIASLTAELEQWKRADTIKAEQIATTVEQIENLQRELSVSASQLAELRGHHEAQSRELVSVRRELQSRTSSNEEKDCTIVALTADIEEWKRTDVMKEEHIATALANAEGLQQELTITTSQIAELRQRYELQSTELGSLRDQLQGDASDKDDYISSLASQLEEWERLDATKGEELAIARKDLAQLRRDLATSSSQIENWKRLDAAKTTDLTTTQKELEQLRRDLSASSSQIAEYQQRCSAQSTQSVEFTSQIEHWKRSDATKAEELIRANKRLEQLQDDLATASSRLAELQQRYETQCTDLRSLHEQLQGDKDRTVATLNTEIEQWRRADAAKAKELEQLQRRLSASSFELEALKKSTSMLETREVYKRITTEGVKDHAAIIQLTATVDSWLRADAKRAEELALELAKRNKENDELRHNLLTLKEIYILAPELRQIFQSETIEVQKRYEEQLADRQSQLDGVQRFVTTADKYADTMIIQELLKLNAEVQQNTTFIAECMLEEFQSRATKERTSAAQRVSESIGQTLAGCLGKKERNAVALYLPIAFQAYLTYYLHSTVSSWTIKKERNEFINEIYEKLQKSEAQTISGRWRSLTRTYISPTCISNPDALTSVIIAGLSDIVVAAGCATSISAARSRISAEFGNKVLFIVSVAGQFSRMIGEVVSADFEVCAVRPVQAFEETTMEEDADDYDKGASSGTMTGKVLCSTHLGMMKRMQLDSGNKDTLMVVKTKVVLESLLSVA